MDDNWSKNMYHNQIIVLSAQVEQLENDFSVMQPLKSWKDNIYIISQYLKFKMIWCPTGAQSDY